MGREVDVRDPNTDLASAERKSDLEARAAQLTQLFPGTLRITIGRFDPTTGNPAALVFEPDPKSESSPNQRTPGPPVQTALAAVQKLGLVLGLAPTQPAEYVADAAPQRISSGGVAVHFQQHYQAIPILDATLTVWFTPDGTLTEVVGRSVTIKQPVPVAAAVTVETAALTAARHVAAWAADEPVRTDPFGQPLPSPSVDLTGFVPKIIRSFSSMPEHPTLLQAGPFAEPIRASLAWFPVGDTVLLAWEVNLVTSDDARYRVLVDARDGSILYAQRVP